MSTQQAADGGGCFHCGLPLPPHGEFQQQIEGQRRHFCCLGCQSVCAAIYEAGLDGFYQRTPDGTLLAPPPEPPRDLALFDLDAVQEEFVRELGAEREINLLVEGIHCAACVWLIERRLGTLPGILRAQVNLANKRLLLRWDNRQVQLSTIIKRLADIGYTATPFDPESAEGAIKKQNRALLFRMAVAGFAMMNLMWISIALYSGADTADGGQFRPLFHGIGFALATLTLFYSGSPFLKGAWAGLRHRHLTMDLPIAIGASATYLYSTYVTFNPAISGEVYFDTVVNFLFVILIGRYLEAMSKRQAVASTQRLLDLQPRVATLLVGDDERVVPIRSVKAGETVLVRGGEKVPVDGVVISGQGEIDESMLSGESQPVRKGAGEPVCAGTVNLHGALTLRVTATLRNTSLGHIIALVEEAQASRAPIQCMADRIVPWFVVVTLLLATLTFLWWVRGDFELALLAATSVLIITCPCAFGLATPMSIAVATGLAARYGILVKNGAVLETLSHVTHVVFDKTGTLTSGQMQLQQLSAREPARAEELLRQAASVEHYSEHSIARAIVEAAREQGLPLSDITPEAFESQLGYGVQGVVEGRFILLGTLHWLRQHKTEIDEGLREEAWQLEEGAATVVHMAVDGEHVAILAIADQLRPDAPRLVQQLRAAGIRMTLLSGDRRRVAAAVAAQLGGMEVIAEVLPQDKDQAIAALQSRGEWVAMVGDGVNDAPALMRANVGIALGSGTDVSMESADIVLMGDELDKVRLATALSRRTLRTIRQNITLSLAYNAIMVPLAMMAFITPLVAAIAMPISSLLVIGNAARIRTLFKGLR
ncbi:MAG: heavy metal translocating P-type ATPase [Gammaproteobacteria bacterium]|nr:heavy metal translocating P-type ATPase [Gammaproteobacteria bacterium]